MLINTFKYTEREWNWAKAITIIVWLVWCTRILLKFDEQPFPAGFCNLINCSSIAKPFYEYFFIGVLTILALFYLRGLYMTVSTFLVSIFSILIFSLEISNSGQSSRMEIFSMVFIVQFVAYFQYFLSGESFRLSNRPHDLAMMYSIQIIAAAYVIAGICKLQESGFAWVMEAQNFSVRIIRSYTIRAIDSDDLGLILKGREIADFIIEHSNLMRVLFFSALAIEILAFIAVFTKKNARLYGLVLLILHTGMFLALGGFLPSFVILVFIYLLNLPGLFLINVESSGTQLSDTVSSIVARGKSFFFADFIRQVRIPIIYIVASFLIGEFHPFSKFPMFSSASDSAELFYLADESHVPISGVKFYSIRCGEIKNMMNAQAQKQGISVQDSAKMHQVANGVLNYILSEQKTSAAFRIKELNLMKRNIVLKKQVISESNIVMATRKI